MKSKAYFYFVGITITGFFSLSAAVPSLVVSSTEQPNEGGKEDPSIVLPAYPLIYDMNIKSNVSNRFAKTLVASKVRNHQQLAKETTFTVVLPEKAYISEFVMEIGGKSYKAYVKEKEEAKKDYNKAVQAGQTAGHVEVSARDSNRFTVSINLEPEAKAVFLLTYEELLERRDDQYELVLNIHPGHIVKRLNVEVHIAESRPLKFVKTPALRSGNEIGKEDKELDPLSNIKIINSTSAIVRFAPDVYKQKQFAARLGGKESDGLSGQFVVQYDVERDPHGGEVLLDDGYFIHFFAPSDLKPLPKHVVFVLDTSGSMDGRKMAQLKDAMKNILDEINKDDIINIVEFDNEAKVWDVNSQKAITIEGLFGKFQEPFPALSELRLPSPALATEETISQAKEIINKLDASGGTNIIEGLETALYLVKIGQKNGMESDKQHQPIIVFLTDGDPNVGMYSTEEITTTITKINAKTDNVPIFSLSFGEDADKEFMKKLSLKNLGFSRHIYEASDASLQLQEFYKQISSPLLSNVNFTYAETAENVTKSSFPIYFGGAELVVAGRYRDPSFDFIVDCWSFDGLIQLRSVVERPVTSLERLWAYLTVKQTLEQRDSVENKTELTKKALDLALKYSFVTDVTSLVVVKPNDTSAVNTEDASKHPGWYNPYDSYDSNNNYQHSAAAPASALIGNRGGGFMGLYDLRFRTTTRMPTSAQPTFMPNLDTIPWLSSVLNDNRSITIQGATYELGDDFSQPTDTVECSKTPLSGTDSGICTLLQDCPEVHSLLTDFDLYQEYFCPLENRYAGVCCPTKETSN